MGDSRPILDKVTQDVLTADGAAMNVEGSLSLSFLLTTLKFNQKFTVIDVGIDGILGLDFLTSNNCSLDLPNSSLLIGGERVRGYVKATLQEILIVNYVCSVFSSLFTMKDQIISMKLFLISTN
jgi:hypothetical protein